MTIKAPDLIYRCALAAQLFSFAGAEAASALFLGLGPGLTEKSLDISADMAYHC